MSLRNFSQQIADKLAKKNIGAQFVGPNPALGIYAREMRTLLREEVGEKHQLS